MLRRFFGGMWDKMTTPQLKDELALRGLRRAGTREELVKRLKDAAGTGKELSSFASHSEIVTRLKNDESSRHSTIQKHKHEEKKAVSAPASSESPLSSLTKSQIILEITKLNPDVTVNSRLPKQQLLELLTSQTKQKSNLDFEVPEIQKLLRTLDSSSQDMPLPEVFSALSNITILDRISQNDLNFLLLSDSSTFSPLWISLFPRISALSPQQLYSLLHIIHLFKVTLQKEVTSGAAGIDSSALANVAGRILAIGGNLTLVEMATAANLLHVLGREGKSFADAGKKLRTRVLKRSEKEGIRGLSAEELFSVFEALPERAFEEKTEVVESILITLFRKEFNWSRERVLTALHKLYEIRAPVPLSIASSISCFPEDFLKRLNPLSLYSLLKLILAAHNFTDAAGLSLYSSIVQLLSNTGYLPFLLSNQSLYRKLITCEGQLDLPTLLRLCISLTPLLANDRLIRVTATAVGKVKVVGEDMRKLMDKTLEKVMKESAEKPVYGYQFLSVRAVELNKRRALCTALAEKLLISKTDATTALLAYISSPLCSSFPQNLIWKTAKRDSAAVFFKALKRYYDSVPDCEELAFAMVVKVVKNNPKAEELYRAVVLDDILTRKLKHSNPNNQKPRVKNYVASFIETANLLKFPDTTYVIPLLQVLNLPLSAAISGLLTPQHIRSQYGEPLVQTLLYLLKTANMPQLALEGLPNLSFLPYDFPSVLAVPLILALADLHSLYEYDPTPLKLLIKRYAGILDDGQKTKTAWFLMLFGVKVKNRPNDKECKYVLNRLRKGLIHDTEALSDAVNNLEKTSTREQALGEIPSVLAYLAMVGQSAAIMPIVNSVIEKFDLWGSLSLESAVDLLVLCVENKAKVDERMVAKVRKMEEIEATEDMVTNPISGLKCYLPFPYCTVLEPRSVSFDVFRSNNNTPRLSEFALTPNDEEFYWKLNAISNALSIAKSEHTKHTMRQIADCRKNADTLRYVEEFSAIYSRVMRNTEKPSLFYFDEVSAWGIDIAVPSANLAVYFLSDSELLQTSQKPTSTLLWRLSREQLEGAGWTVQKVKKSAWKAMSPEDKEALVSRIRKKA